MLFPPTTSNYQVNPLLVLPFVDILFLVIPFIEGFHFHSLGQWSTLPSPAGCPAHWPSLFHLKCLMCFGLLHAPCPFLPPDTDLSHLNHQSLTHFFPYNQHLSVCHPMPYPPTPPHTIHTM